MIQDTIATYEEAMAKETALDQVRKTLGDLLTTYTTTFHNTHIPFVYREPIGNRRTDGLAGETHDQPLVLNMNT